MLKLIKWKVCYVYKFNIIYGFGVGMFVFWWVCVLKRFLVVLLWCVCSCFVLCFIKMFVILCLIIGDVNGC